MIRALRGAIIALACLMVCASSHAADAASAESGVSGSLLQTVAGLAAVLGLIWGAAWLLRRLQVNIGGAQGALKVVASQGVGQRERIVVVEIADRWLVVGVAPGHVSSLATLDKGTLPVAGPAASNSFAGFLARARGEVKPR